MHNRTPAAGGATAQGENDGSECRAAARVSPGWRYATDQPAQFAGNEARRVPVGDAEEYRVWEAPNLTVTRVTLFVREARLAEAVKVSVNAGEGGWREVPHRVAAAEPAGGAWLMVELVAEVAGPAGVSHVRLTVPPGVATDEGGALQLGHVRLRGRNLE